MNEAPRQTPESAKGEEARGRARLRRLAAVVVTLVVTGSGHFILGRPARGLVFVASLIACILAIPFAGVAAIAGLVAFYVATVIDTLRIRPKPTRHAALVVASIAVLFVALLAVRAGVRAGYTEAFRIPSSGMAPNLLAGEHIFVDKFRRAPRRGDIVVYRHPEDPDVKLIHRVVALGGDRLKINGGMLYLDGEPRQQREEAECAFWGPGNLGRGWTREVLSCRVERLGDDVEYLVTFDADSHLNYFPAAVTSGSEYAVADGTAFMLGDNRASSRDSRDFGPVPLDHVEAITNFVWWSSTPDGVRWSRVGTRLR